YRAHRVVGLSAWHRRAVHRHLGAGAPARPLGRRSAHRFPRGLSDDRCDQLEGELRVSSDVRSVPESVAGSKKQSLAVMLANARARVTDGPRPRQDRNNVPLSYSQNTLWFVDQLQPGETTYNVAFAFRLDGELNADALAAALASIVVRHEALRTYV